jgi:hypothetical protein
VVVVGLKQRRGHEGEAGRDLKLLVWVDFELDFGRKKRAWPSEGACQGL